MKFMAQEEVFVVNKKSRIQEKPGFRMHGSLLNLMKNKHQERFSREGTLRP